MSSSRRRILVVDDESHLAEGIKENLDAEGYVSEIASHGHAALEAALGASWDLIILDVMLPGMDGYAVCEAMRARGVNTPVLFLTAKGSAEDRIRGLEAGGDDYLPKPFHLREFLLRVAAILKRAGWYEAAASGSSVEFGGNSVDFRSFTGRSADAVEHQLSHKEALILKALVEREGEVVSREEILERAWGYEAYPSTRTIDNFIVKLRKRFEPDPEAPRFIHTVRGVGYRFTLKPGGDRP